jgi:uncharacterized protein
MTLLTPQHGNLPWAPPRPSAPSLPFWDGCRAGELRFQRCGGCGVASFPPVTHCRRCLSTDQAWETSAGRGTVYSWTTVWRPVTPDFHTPYAVAIVDLAEGFEMLTNIVECEPDDVRVGLAVEVVFHTANEALTLPYFRPAASEVTP